MRALSTKRTTNYKKQRETLFGILEVQFRDHKFQRKPEECATRGKWAGFFTEKGGKLTQAYTICLNQRVRLLYTDDWVMA